MISEKTSIGGSRNEIFGRGQPVSRKRGSPVPLCFPQRWELLLVLGPENSR